MYKLSRSSSATSPYAIYPSSMFSLDLGYALWYPEPHARTGEPHVGDVGYTSDGAFIRLFNVDKSNAEHAVTFPWKPVFPLTDSNVPSPDIFAMLDQRRRPIEPGPYPSHGVRKAEIGGSILYGRYGASGDISVGYTCKDTQGGLLVLQSEAEYASVFAVAHLKTYVAKHHESWLMYARSLGCEVSEEDVFLVGGWVKTSADWKATAFSNHATKKSLSLKGAVSGMLGLGFHGSDSRSDYGAKSHRQGTKYRNNNDKPPQNDLSKDQAVFLKRYKVKRRLGVLKTIVAGAGYDQLPRGGGSDGYPGAGIAVNLDGEDHKPEDNGIHWLEDKIVDPLDVLLDYILEISDADVAVACDLDLESIVGVDVRPIDFATYLRKVQPPVDLSSQYGTISIPALLSQEHVKKLEKRLVKREDIRRWPKISLDRAGAPSLAVVRFKDATDTSPDIPSKWHYLRFQAFEQPGAAPRPVMGFSPDDKLFAAVSDLCQITVWRLVDGLSVQTLQEGGHSFIITAISFSPDSQHLASCSHDETIIIWDISSGRALRRLVGHQEPVEHVSYAAGGSLLASASSDSVVKIWDAHSGSPLCQFSHSETITRLLISADGLYMAVEMTRSVAVYDTQDAVQLAILECHQDAKVASVAFDPFMNRLFISDHRGRGCTYSLRTCNALKIFDDLPTKVHCAAFAPDRDALAVALNHTVGIITAYAPLELPFRLGVFVAALAISSDGEFIAAAGGEGTTGRIKVWSMRTRGLVVGYDTPSSNFFEIAFSSDNEQLLTFGEDGHACSWSVQDALRMH
ncbi:WD40 repeat domain-containing protein [Phanerochaete sordida]|uniref:WD40 repeat domain-containing protein n=1 Tax=Phanerochaete sordida TaxID=48140 RepID=A0A9P3GG55_9APHY|nr:WD40 repeat domain-containing protein [Phanerochaete sordida]